jgi:hypothetical protein
MMPKPQIIGQHSRLAEIEDLHHYGHQGNGLAHHKTERVISRVKNETTLQ